MSEKSVVQLSESNSRSSSTRHLTPDTRSSKSIIYIQDAHDSLEAQINIANIIRHLVHRHGIKTVFEEGYEGPVPGEEYFGFIKDPKMRRKVSYFLMDKLRLGGAEYAYINREKRMLDDGSWRMEKKQNRTSKIQAPISEFQDPGSTIQHASFDFRLIGVDRMDLYREGLTWYRQSAAQRKQTEEDLKRMLAEIQGLADRCFPKAMKDWMKLRQRLDEHQIELMEYVKRLWEIYAVPGVRSQVPGKNTVSNAETVLQPAISDLSPDTRHPAPVPYPSLSLLLAAEQGAGTVPSELTHPLQSIAPRTLFAEIRKLEDDFAAEILRRDEDRRIFHAYKILSLFKRLMAIEISAAEFAAVKDALTDFNTASLAKLIVEQKGKPLVLSKLWEPYLRNAVGFYEAAFARDAAIEKELEQFRGNPDENAAILVFGGFHKDNITATLKRMGFSYYVISPKITAPSTRHERYYKRLMSVGYHPFEKPFLLPAAWPIEHVFALSQGRNEVRYVHARWKARRAHRQFRAIALNSIPGGSEGLAPVKTRAEALLAGQARGEMRSLRKALSDILGREPRYREGAGAESFHRSVRAFRQRWPGELPVEMKAPVQEALWYQEAVALIRQTFVGSEEILRILHSILRPSSEKAESGEVLLQSPLVRLLGFLHILDEVSGRFPQVVSVMSLISDMERKIPENLLLAVEVAKNYGRNLERVLRRLGEAIRFCEHIYERLYGSDLAWTPALEALRTEWEERWADHSERIGRLVEAAGVIRFAVCGLMETFEERTVEDLLETLAAEFQYMVKEKNRLLSASPRDYFELGIESLGKTDELIRTLLIFVPLADEIMRGIDQLEAQWQLFSRRIDSLERQEMRSSEPAASRAAVLAQLRSDPVLSSYVTEEDMPDNVYLATWGGEGEIYFSNDPFDPVYYKVAHVRSQNARVSQDGRALADLAHLSESWRTLPLQAVGVNGWDRVYLKLKKPLYSVPLKEAWDLLTPVEKMDIAIHIAETYQLMHAKGWVHQDVKPAHVLIALPLLNKGETAIRSPLIDFGIAKKFDSLASEDYAEKISFELQKILDLFDQLLQFQSADDMRESGLRALLDSQRTARPQKQVSLDEMIAAFRKARDYFAKTARRKVGEDPRSERIPLKIETQSPDGLRSFLLPYGDYHYGALVVENQSALPREGSVLLPRSSIRRKAPALESGPFVMWDRWQRGYFAFEWGEGRNIRRRGDDLLLYFHLLPGERHEWEIETAQSLARVEMRNLSAETPSLAHAEGLTESVNDYIQIILHHYNVLIDDAIRDGIISERKGARFKRAIEQLPAFGAFVVKSLSEALKKLNISHAKIGMYLVGGLIDRTIASGFRKKYKPFHNGSDIDIVLVVEDSTAKKLDASIRKKVHLELARALYHAFERLGISARTNGYLTQYASEVSDQAKRQQLYYNRQLAQHDVSGQWMTESEYEDLINFEVRFSKVQILRDSPVFFDKNEIGPRLRLAETRVEMRTRRNDGQSGVRNVNESELNDHAPEKTAAFHQLLITKVPAVAVRPGLGRVMDMREILKHVKGPERYEVLARDILAVEDVATPHQFAQGILPLNDRVQSMTEKMRDFSRDPHAVWLLFVDETGVVKGLAEAGPFQKDGQYKLHDLETSKRADQIQGRGIFLMDTLFETLIQKGVRSLYWESTYDAVPFYNKYLTMAGYENFHVPDADGYPIWTQFEVVLKNRNGRTAAESGLQIVPVLKVPQTSGGRKEMRKPPLVFMKSGGKYLGPEDRKCIGLEKAFIRRAFRMDPNIIRKIYAGLRVQPSAVSGIVMRRVEAAGHSKILYDMEVHIRGTRRNPEPEAKHAAIRLVLPESKAVMDRDLNIPEEIKKHQGIQKRGSAFIRRQHAVLWASYEEDGGQRWLLAGEWCDGPTLTALISGAVGKSIPGLKIENIPESGPSDTGDYDAYRLKMFLEQESESKDRMQIWFGRAVLPRLRRLFKVVIKTFCDTGIVFDFFPDDVLLPGRRRVMLIDAGGGMSERSLVQVVNIFLRMYSDLDISHLIRGTEPAGSVIRKLSPPAETYLDQIPDIIGKDKAVQLLRFLKWSYQSHAQSLRTEIKDIAYPPDTLQEKQKALRKYIQLAAHARQILRRTEMRDPAEAEKIYQYLGPESSQLESIHPSVMDFGGALMGLLQGPLQENLGHVRTLIDTFGMFGLHGDLVYDRKKRMAFVISANAGAGKSSTTIQLLTRFGDRFQVLADDQLIAFFDDQGQLYVGAAGYNGKTSTIQSHNRTLSAQEYRPYYGFVRAGGFVFLQPGSGTEPSVREGSPEIYRPLLSAGASDDPVPEEMILKLEQAGLAAIVAEVPAAKSAADYAGAADQLVALLDGQPASALPPFVTRKKRPHTEEELKGLLGKVRGSFSAAAYRELQHMAGFRFEPPVPRRGLTLKKFRPYLRVVAASQKVQLDIIDRNPFAWYRSRFERIGYLLKARRWSLLPEAVLSFFLVNDCRVERFYYPDGPGELARLQLLTPRGTFFPLEWAAMKFMVSGGLAYLRETGPWYAWALPFFYVFFRFMSFATKAIRRERMQTYLKAWQWILLERLCETFHVGPEFYRQMRAWCERRGLEPQVYGSRITPQLLKETEEELFAAIAQAVPKAEELPVPVETDGVRNPAAAGEGADGPARSLSENAGAGDELSPRHEGERPEIRSAHVKAEDGPSSADAAGRYEGLRVMTDADGYAGRMDRGRRSSRPDMVGVVRLPNFFHDDTPLPDLKHALRELGETAVFFDAGTKFESDEQAEQTARELARIADAGGKVELYNVETADGGSVFMRNIMSFSFPRHLNKNAGSYVGKLAQYQNRAQVRLIHYAAGYAAAGPEIAAEKKGVIHLGGNPGSGAFGIMEYARLKKASDEIAGEKLRQGDLIKDIPDLGIQYRSGYFLVSAEKAAWMSAILEMQSHVEFAQAA